MLLKSIAISSCLCLYVFVLTAQDKPSPKCPVKFGEVSLSDFDISKLNIDTTEGAVIIADKGYSSFEGTNNGWFSLEYKHQVRIRIINKNGFDLANVEVPLYQNGEDREVLENVKGITYNIENGQVVATKFGKDIFEDKLDKNRTVKKFTLPSVKEGSIIEYSYTVNSNFLFNLQPWEFQGEYPRAWSEYEVSIPEFFRYVFLTQGYLPFSKEESAGRSSFILRVNGDEAYGRSDVITITGNTTNTRWVMQNVPALKKEKFTSSIQNHISKVEFQMAGIQFPNEPYEDRMGSWPSTGKKLIEREDFGVPINKNNGWLEDELKIITANANTDIDKVRKIYYYVKNNIRSTGRRGILMEGDLKDVFKNKSGSIADINMLLIAMLRREHISAFPVILSTIDNGYTYPLYPTISRYNYVICQVSVDSNNYYLDATQSYLGFGKLPVYCYNGHARTITEDPQPLFFSPDTLVETGVTNVTLWNDSAIAGKWSGNYSANLNDEESGKVRRMIADKGKDEYEKNLRSSYSEDFSVSDIAINNLDDNDKNIQTTYSLAVGDNSASDNIIYFNPVINGIYKENPLKSVDRKYPVEMPYLTDDTYSLNLEVPAGYNVDELPKSAKVIFNDSDAIFEYYCSTDGGMINVMSHLKFMKATFAPEDYNNLRDFFDYIVKKNSEQIVFKKKK